MAKGFEGRAMLIVNEDVIGEKVPVWVTGEVGLGGTLSIKYEPDVDVIRSVLDRYSGKATYDVEKIMSADLENFKHEVDVVTEPSKHGTDLHFYLNALNILTEHKLMILFVRVVAL